MRPQRKRTKDDSAVAAAVNPRAGEGVIDGEEFEAARRDPEIRKQLAAAKAYRAKLTREGRNR